MGMERAPRSMASTCEASFDIGFTRDGDLAMAENVPGNLGGLWASFSDREAGF